MAGLCCPKPWVKLLDMTDSHVCGAFETSKGKRLVPMERGNQKFMKQRAQHGSVLTQKYISPK